MEIEVKSDSQTTLPSLDLIRFLLVARLCVSVGGRGGEGGGGEEEEEFKG